MGPSAQALWIYLVGFSDGCGRGPPRLELSVGRGPPRLILIFDSDSDSNKNTHWCIHVFSLASICYMYTMLAAAAV